MKLIFCFPVHKEFDSALELYRSIKKFNNDPLAIFASSRDVGYSVDNLKKIKSKRIYKLGWMHNFLFDVIEEVKDMDFDYLIKLDSDSLFANYGFDKILDKDTDFFINRTKSDKRWTHGRTLRRNMS